jgi:predicted nucleic acid-binding Zn ribbon protein
MIPMDSLQALVPRVLVELFRQGPMSQGKLEAAWRIAVGEAISRISTVRLQPDGSVDVLAADQRWHRELKRSSPVILNKLNALLGQDAVRTLHVH